MGRHWRSRVIGCLPRGRSQSPLRWAWETVASRWIPVVLGPFDPVKSINGPRFVQSSCQKRAKFPEQTLLTRKGLARGLSLRILFHNQLPASSTKASQKILPRCRLALTQETHREPLLVKSNQISLNPNTLFQSSSFLRPNPPSSLGVQTEAQAIFEPLAELGAPDHRKVL